MHSIENSEISVGLFLGHESPDQVALVTENKLLGVVKGIGDDRTPSIAIDSEAAIPFSEIKLVQDFESASTDINIIMILNLNDLLAI